MLYAKVGDTIVITTPRTLIKVGRTYKVKGFNTCPLMGKRNYVPCKHCPGYVLLEGVRHDHLCLYSCSNPSFNIFVEQELNIHEAF